MRKRNWLVEDNLVALYLALYGSSSLPMSERQIAGVIRHKGFPMRVQQYIAIATSGKAGLRSGLKSPLFKQLFKIAGKLDKTTFRALVRLILEVKTQINRT